MGIVSNDKNEVNTASYGFFFFFSESGLWTTCRKQNNAHSLHAKQIYSLVANTGNVLVYRVKQTLQV